MNRKDNLCFLSGACQKISLATLGWWTEDYLSRGFKYEIAFCWKFPSVPGIWPTKLVTATCSPFFSVMMISYFSSFPIFGVLCQACTGDPGQFRTLVAGILAQAAKWSENKLVYYQWKRKSGPKRDKKTGTKGDKRRTEHTIIKQLKWQLISRKLKRHMIMTLGLSIHVYFKEILFKRYNSAEHSIYRLEELFTCHLFIP